MNFQDTAGANCNKLMLNVSLCHYSLKFKIYTILTRKLHMNPLLIPKQSDLQSGQARHHFNHPFPVVSFQCASVSLGLPEGGGGCQAAVPLKTEI